MLQCKKTVEALGYRERNGKRYHVFISLYGIETEIRHSVFALGRMKNHLIMMAPEKYWARMYSKNDKPIWKACGWELLKASTLAGKIK